MKIVTGMAENGEFKVMINSTLIRNYLPNLVGMIKSNKDCPKDIRVERDGEDTVYLIFQMGVGGSMTTPQDGKVGVDEVGAKPLTQLLSVAKRFSIVAFKHTMKKQEFIPLSGYSIEDLQKDLPAALKNHRSFVLIDTFDHYKDLMEQPDASFKQYSISYDSDEYIDVCLMIHRGDLEGLKKKYGKKLENYSWV